MSNELNESNISGLSLSDDALDFLIQDMEIDLNNVQDSITNDSQKTVENSDNDKNIGKSQNNSENNSLEDILAELCEKNDLEFTQVSLDKFSNGDTIEPADFQDVWQDESTNPAGTFLIPHYLLTIPIHSFTQ